MDTKNKKYLFLINNNPKPVPKDSYHVWHPATDLFETSQAYIVKIEICGMKDEGFSINFDKNILTVLGTRIGDDSVSCYHRMEIPYGEFSTSIHIPGKVNINLIEAFYKNGILTVVLPKSSPINVEIKE
jgi:HSP20 family protein